MTIFSLAKFTYKYFKITGNLKKSYRLAFVHNTIYDMQYHVDRLERLMGVIDPKDLFFVKQNSNLQFEVGVKTIVENGESQNESDIMGANGPGANS